MPLAAEVETMRSFFSNSAINILTDVKIWCAIVFRTRSNESGREHRFGNDENQSVNGEKVQEKK